MGLLRSDERSGLGGSRLEALHEGRHLAEELRELAQELGTCEAGEGFLNETESDADADATPATALAASEPVKGGGVERVVKPLGGVEEIGGVQRRRRVEHDEVVAPAGGEVVEPLCRGEFVGTGEAGGEEAVEAVGLQRGALRRVGHPAAEDGREGLVGLEHGGPHLAGQRRVGEPHGLVGERGNAERVGEATGGVDGENKCATPRCSSLPGEQGAHGGLAYAAASYADKNPRRPDKLLQRLHQGCSGRSMRSARRSTSASVSA